MKHPARYALVELVNLHDDSLTFEPIDRVVFNCRLEDMLERMEAYFRSQGSSFSYSTCAPGEAFTAIPPRLPDTHLISFFTGGPCGTISIGKPRHSLEVGSLQMFLDDYMKSRPEVKIDYIHGEEIVKGLRRSHTVTFFLPPYRIRLLQTIIVDGVLPRKTFSWAMPMRMVLPGVQEDHRIGVILSLNVRKRPLVSQDRGLLLLLRAQMIPLPGKPRRYAHSPHFPGENRKEINLWEDGTNGGGNAGVTVSERPGRPHRVDEKDPVPPVLCRQVPPEDPRIEQAPQIPGRRGDHKAGRV